QFEGIKTTKSEARSGLAVRRRRAGRRAVAGGIMTEIVAGSDRAKPGVDRPAQGSPDTSLAPEKPFKCVHRQVGDEQVCVLTFDRPDSSANTFDRATLEALNQHLDFIARSPELKGLVLASAKNSIFVAGADLHALAGSW